MIRKCHNHTLQTYPRHQEDTKNATSNMTSRGQLMHGNQLSFSQQDDCKLEMTLSTDYQNKDITQPQHSQNKIKINDETATSESPP